MTWEWSHTSEAYENVRANIDAQERSWLETVWAEWQARDSREASAGGFNLKRYDRALKRAKKLPSDELAEDIWDHTQEQALCSNGGWEAYCCPFACGCHQLPFDLQDGATLETE